MRDSESGRGVDSGHVSGAETRGMTTSAARNQVNIPAENPLAVAVISAVCGVEDPRAAARELVAAFAAERG